MKERSEECVLNVHHFNESLEEAQQKWKQLLAEREQGRGKHDCSTC